MVEIVIDNKDYNNLKKCLVILKMEYFDNICYDNNPIPYWKRNAGPLKTAEDYKKARRMDNKSILYNLNKLRLYFNYYTLIDFDKYTLIFEKILSGDKLNKKELNLLKTNPLFYFENYKEVVKDIAQTYIKQNEIPALNTFINIIKAIVNILSRCHYDKHLTNNYYILSNTLTHLNHIFINYKKQNIIESDINNQLKIFDYDDVDNLKYLIDKANLKEKEKAIVAVYLFFPPRRIQDYIEMIKYNSYDENITNNTDSNFIICNDVENTLEYFIFNKYKTSSKYGRQMYNILEYNNLHDYIYPYIKNIEVGEYIFKKDNGKKYSQGDFSLKICNILYKIFGIKMSLNDVRNCAENYNNKPGRSFNTKEVYSHMMGHSFMVGQSYIRNNCETPI